jgi:GTP cyclohydrolase II
MEDKNTMIVRLAEGPLRTKFGTFLEILYYDGQQEIIAIVMGDVRQGEHVFCRLHSHCLTAHVFNPTAPLLKEP